MSLCSRVSACKGVSRRMLCQQVVSRSWRLLCDLVCSRGTLKFRSCRAGSRAKRCQTRNQVHDFCRAASSSANSIQGWPEKVHQGKCRGSVFCNVPEERGVHQHAFGRHSWSAMLSRWAWMKVEPRTTWLSVCWLLCPLKQLLGLLYRQMILRCLLWHATYTPLLQGMTCSAIFSSTLQRMNEFHTDCSMCRRRYTSCRLK